MYFSSMLIWLAVVTLTSILSFSFLFQITLWIPTCIIYVFKSKRRRKSGKEWKIKLRWGKNMPWHLLPSSMIIPGVYLSLTDWQIEWLHKGCIIFFNFSEKKWRFSSIKVWNITSWVLCFCKWSHNIKWAIRSAPCKL